MLLSFAAFVFLATAPGNSYASGALYSNSWAVEVRGGAAVADTLAHKYGFANLGQVKLTAVTASLVLYYMRLYIKYMLKQLNVFTANTVAYTTSREIEIEE